MNPDKMLSAGFETVPIAAILGDVNAAVALAGTLQTDATLLKQDNNIITSGTGGVRLPPPKLVGHRVFIFNNSGATATVYPSTGGKINGGTANAGITVLDGNAIELRATNSLDWFSKGAVASVTGPASATSGGIATFNGTSGRVLQDNTTPTISGGNIRLSAGDALTAAGTNRATSLALTAQLNNITTAASGTGVTLPAAVAGLIIAIDNAGANAIKVYGAGSDTIDGAAAATGVDLTNTKRALYICFAAPAWISAQLGVVSA